MHACVCRTPLHAAVVSNNSEALSLLLTAGGLDLESRDCNGHTVLWLALSSDTFDFDDDRSYARQLIAHGSSPNTLINDNGNVSLSYLHVCHCTDSCQTYELGQFPDFYVTFFVVFVS